MLNAFKSKDKNPKYIKSILDGKEPYTSFADGLGLTNNGILKPEYQDAAYSLGERSGVADRTSIKRRSIELSEAQDKIIHGNPGIFVSSTFIDMQHERDVLHYQVLPELNKFADKYKQKVSLTDLRWGIDTSNLDEEESCRKIIEICNREIDKCRPYILVLVGDRYGWVPDGSDVSVTEMEIEYGIFSRPENKDRAIFLIRNLEITEKEAAVEENRRFLPENPQALAAVTKLKARIRSDFADRVIDYDAFTNNGRIEFDEKKLCAQIVNKFEDMLQADFGMIASMSEGEKNCYRWEQVLNNTAGKFADIHDELNDIKKQASEGTVLQCISVDEGEGGTTALLTAAQKMRDEFKVYGYIPEMGIGQADPYSLLHQLIWYAEDALCIEHYEDANGREAETNINELRTKLSRLLKQLDDEEIAVAFFVDTPSSYGADMAQLAAVSEKNILHGDFKIQDCSNVTTWLPAYISKYARFIITDHYCKVPVIYTESTENGVRLATQLTLDKLSGSAQAELARAFCKSMGKELPENVADIFENNFSGLTPLHIKLCCMGLMNMGEEDFDKIRQDGRGMNSISDYMADYVKNMCDNEENEAWRVMTHTAKQINPELIEHFLLPQALGFFGNGVQDLIEISEGKISELDIYLFLNLFEDFFIHDEHGLYRHKYEKLKNLAKCMEELGKDCVRKHYERETKYLRRLDWNNIYKINEYQFRLITMLMGVDTTAVPEFISNVKAIEKIEEAALRKWACFRSAQALWIGAILAGKQDAFFYRMERALEQDKEEELISMMHHVRTYVEMMFISDDQNRYANTMYELIGRLMNLLLENYPRYEVLIDTASDKAVSLIQNDKLMERATLELAMCRFTSAVIASNTKWADERADLFELARMGLEYLVQAFPDNSEYVEAIAGVLEWIGFDKKNAGENAEELFVRAFNLYALCAKQTQGDDHLSALRGVSVEANYVGDIKREEKKYSEAFEVYRISVQSAAEVYLNKRSQYAYSDLCIALKQLAYLAIDQKDYLRAAEFIRDALTVAEVGLREFPGDWLIKDLALLNECAGFLFIRMGSKNEAVSYFARSVELYEKLEDKTNPGMLYNEMLAKQNYEAAVKGKLVYPR